MLQKLFVWHSVKCYILGISILIYNPIMGTVSHDLVLQD